MLFKRIYIIMLFYCCSIIIWMITFAIFGYQAATLEELISATLIAACGSTVGFGFFLFILSLDFFGRILDE